MDKMDCRVDMNDLPKLLEVNNAVTKLISEGKDFGYFKDTYGMNSVEFDMYYFMRMNKLTGDEVVEVIKIACANFISPRTAMRLQKIEEINPSFPLDELLALHKIVHKDVMEYIKSQLEEKKRMMDIMLEEAFRITQDFGESYVAYSVATDRLRYLLNEREKMHEHQEVDSTNYQWMDVQCFTMQHMQQQINWKELSLCMINEQIQIYYEISRGERDSEISDIMDAVIGVVDQKMDSNEALSEQDCPRASRKRKLDDSQMDVDNSEGLLPEVKRESFGVQSGKGVSAFNTITGLALSNAEDRDSQISDL